jgi:WD repeat-containing protein 68
MWIPDTVNKPSKFMFFIFRLLKKGTFPDLLATSGDYLRVWQTSDNGTRLECLLNNVKLLPFF